MIHLMDRTAFLSDLCWTYPPKKEVTLIQKVGQQFLTTLDDLDSN